MSVIGGSGVLGRTARRRLVGVTAAVAATAVEVVAVGTWFALVGVGSRTSSTAIAGLGVLVCGSLLRSGVFGAATGVTLDPARPRRIAAALVLAGTWPVWLLVAEAVGGVPGIVVAAAVLAAVLAGQFALEQHVFVPIRRRVDPVYAVGPALLVAAGATTLLAATWLTDWAVRTTPLAVGATAVVFRVEGFQIGLAVFAAFAFLAQQRRFQRTLEP